MRQSEFKKRYDVKTGKYVKFHIYNKQPIVHGEGYGDVFKTIGKKVLGETMQKLAKNTAKKVAKTALDKTIETTGKHYGQKAGEKIVQLLSKKNNKSEQPVTNLPSNEPQYVIPTSPINQPQYVIPTSPINKPQREPTSYEIAQRVNQLLSGGRIKRFM